MLPAKVWTVDAYHRMVETGVLTGSDRVELISPSNHCVTMFLALSSTVEFYDAPAD
jgi:hypothetical protein